MEGREPGALRERFEVERGVEIGGDAVDHALHRVGIERSCLRLRRGIDRRLHGQNVRRCGRGALDIGCGKPS